MFLKYGLYRKLALFSDVESMIKNCCFFFDLPLSSVLFFLILTIILTETTCIDIVGLLQHNGYLRHLVEINFYNAAKDRFRQKLLGQIPAVLFIDKK